MVQGKRRLYCICVVLYVCDCLLYVCGYLLPVPQAKIAIVKYMYVNVLFYTLKQNYLIRPQRWTQQLHRLLKSTLSQ